MEGIPLGRRVSGRYHGFMGVRISAGSRAYVRPRKPAGTRFVRTVRLHAEIKQLPRSASSMTASRQISCIDSELIEYILDKITCPIFDVPPVSGTLARILSNIKTDIWRFILIISEL